MSRVSAEAWSAISAVASAAAAIFALVISIQQQPAPYQQSLYQERWRAYNEFARATSEFEAAIADANAAITNNVDSREKLRRLSDTQLVKVGQSAASVLQAKRRYTTSLSNIMGPWPNEAVQSIAKLDLMSGRRIRCEILLGVHSTDMQDRPDYWKYVRHEGGRVCNGYHKDRWRRPFDARVHASFLWMLRAIKSNDQEFVPPPAVRLS